MAERLEDLLNEAQEVGRIQRVEDLLGEARESGLAMQATPAPRFDLGGRGADISRVPRTDDLTGTQTFSGRNVGGVPKGSLQEFTLDAASTAAGMVPPMLAGMGAYAAGSELAAAAVPRFPAAARMVGGAFGMGGYSAGEDVLAGRDIDWLKAMLSGTGTLATELGLTGLGYAGARASGVPKETIQDTLGRSTVGRARSMYGTPSKTAELEQADLAQELTKQALGKTTRGRIRAEEKMTRFDLQRVVKDLENEADVAAHPLSKQQFHKSYSETARAEGVKGETPYGLPLHMKSEKFEATYPSAKGTRKRAIERALENGETVPRQILEDFPDLLYKEEAGVDMGPVKQRLERMIKPEAWRSEEEKAVNAAVQKEIGKLPDQMKMRDFDEWITGHTKAVQGQIGAIDSGLSPAAKKEIVRYARGYRNQVLPEARRDFLQSSKDIGTFKRFRKQIMEMKGDLKTSVESVWRRLPQNNELLRAFRRFDEAATRNGIESHLADDAIALARKRDWTSEDVMHAYLLLRGAQRFLIRPLIAKPAILFSKPVAAAAGTGMEGLMSPVAKPFDTKVANEAFMSAMNPRNNP